MRRCAAKQLLPVGAKEQKVDAPDILFGYSTHGNYGSKADVKVASFTVVWTAVAPPGTAAVPLDHAVKSNFGTKSAVHLLL